MIIAGHLGTLYYFIYTIRTRISQLEKNIKPHFSIKFNNNNDLCQFEKDNNNINLLVNNVLGEPVFLSRNSGTINVVLVDMTDRYGIIKPSLERFNDNINAINKINDILKNYKMTDEIREELRLNTNLAVHGFDNCTP